MVEVLIKKRIPWNKGKKLHYPVWNKGIPLDEKHKEILRKLRIGKKHTQAYKDKMSEFMKEYRKTHENPSKRPEVREKIRQTNLRKGITWPKQVMFGDQNPAWKGGITPENVKIRNSIEMNLWIQAVFARDNYTCQKYGIRGGDLVAHHILNFSSYPELRFAIDNGITLSKKAHDEFHKKYGKKNNTVEQLEEFISRKI